MDNSFTNLIDSSYFTGSGQNLYEKIFKKRNLYWFRNIENIAL